MTSDLTIWDYLELTDLQEKELLAYMRRHCVTVEQALRQLAMEALAIDQMCPEISGE